MQIFLSSLLIVEVFIFCFAGALFFLRRNYGFPGAFGLGILVTMSGLSVLYQTQFILGVPWLAVLVEIFCLGISISYCLKCPLSSMGIGSLKAFVSSHKYTVVPLVVVVGYLFAQSVLLYPNNVDSLVYHLPRVLLFQQNGTFFLDSTHMHHIVVFPVGSDILYHHFLRLQLSRGLAFFSILAYVGTILGAYALVRGHFSSRAAWLGALVVAGLPEFVIMSTTPKNDIQVVFAGIISLVLLSRILVNGRLLDFSLLALALCYAVSAKTTGIAISVPIFAAAVFLLKKKKIIPCTMYCFPKALETPLPITTCPLNPLPGMAICVQFTTLGGLVRPRILEEPWDT